MRATPSVSRTLVAVLAAMAWACDRTSEVEPAAERVEAVEARPAADDPADVVRVNASMLRDLRLTTRPVETRTGREEVALLGELAVDENAYAEVGVPVAARIVALLAQPGERVAGGQPLAELHSPELGQARAAYLSAVARVAVAEAALVRARALAEERIVPQREAQEAEAALAEVDAARRAAEATLAAFGVAPPVSAEESGGVPVPAGEDAGLAASRFRLLAPLAGTVIERRVVLGQMLDPADPAFRLADLSRLWLTVQAFERDAVRIREGAAARLTFPALPGRSFAGRVALVGREVDRTSRTVAVRIDVRNADGVLRPGMSSSAAVAVGEDEAQILTVPVASVQRVRDAWSVFVPRDAETFEVRPIGRGRDLGDEVEVLSGLAAGEEVVVEGAFLLRSQADQSEAGHDH